MAPPTDAGRAALVEDAGLADGAGLEWLLEQAEERLHLDPTTAEAALAFVELRAASLGVAAVEGRAHYLHARVLAERGDLEVAVDHIAQARAGFHAAGATLQALRTDLGRMQILDDLGRHADALAVGEALLETLATVETPDPEDAEVKAMITAAASGNCGVAYGYLGLHQRSLAAYERAEQGYAALGMVLESAQWQANRGVELLSLGSAEEAAEALTRAAAGFEAAGDLLWSAKCEGDLAQADHLRGNLVGALARLVGAQETLQRLGADAETARIKLQLGQTYLDAGLWRESTVASGEAAEIATAAGMVHDRAHAHLLAARAAAAGGALTDAEGELATATRLFHEVGDAQFAARSRLVAAELLIQRGAAEKGRAELEGTVDELLTGGWKIPAAHAMLALHDLAVEPGVKAAWLGSADRIATDVGHPQLTTAVQLRQAQELRAAGDTDAAAQVLSSSVNKLEQLGSALSEPLLASAFSASRRPTYDELVHLLAAIGTPDSLAEAVALSDRAKARTLTDLVGGTVGTAGARLQRLPGGPDGEVASHRRSLSAVYAAIHESTDPRRTAPLRDRARELEAQLGDLLIRHHASGPDTSADVEPGTGRSTPDTDRQPGVAFHVVGADVVAFTVDGDRVSGTILRGAHDRARVLVDQLSAQWGRFRMGVHVDLRPHETQLAATTRAILGELYDVLLRPLDLPITVGGSLVVSPDRVLHRIPFHALYDGTGYLLERCPIVVAPTTLAAQQPAPATPPRLLLVGVPDERAPSITDEVELIAGADPSGTTVLLGDRATVAGVAAASADATHLHLACHGMYRDENPLFSSLRFADRWSTVSEVLELDLSGKAVTLSACESGRADDAAEPVGMAWGFLAAGARSVVVSQWVLDDETSAAVMADYHAGLRAGTPAEGALRDAQLAVMRRRPHPYYWAPFVYVASPFASDPGTRSS